MNRDRTTQQAHERFGPRRTVARTGVPADHFVPAPAAMRGGKAKRSLKALRREIARRKAR